MKKLLFPLLTMIFYNCYAQQKFVYLTYEQYVAKAASEIAAKDNRPGFTHHIGDYFGGGIIATLWMQDGVEHGLIVGLADLPELSTDSIAKLNAETLKNIGHLMAWRNPTPEVHWQSADSLCKAYRSGGYSDWRLPTDVELDSIHGFTSNLDNILFIKSNGKGFMKGYYWSSTLNLRDANGGSRWAQLFFIRAPANQDGNKSIMGNDENCGVRPVRKF